MNKKKLNIKNKVLIIAEIGNNHEGSFSLAKKLIEKAAKAGVDAVKFQSYETEEFVNDLDQLKYKRYKKFELSKEQFYKLSKFARSKKLIFISTCSNYGFMSENKLADEDTELKPLSLYAVAKVSIDNYILKKF